MGTKGRLQSLEDKETESLEGIKEDGTAGRLES